jgi:hypothetical protein
MENEVAETHYKSSKNDRERWHLEKLGSAAF